MALIGRPREFDRQTALSAAMIVFWRKGFSATSMNDLCTAMNIRSPSLYAAFGSKEALYREALNLYVGTIGPGVWDSLAQGGTARAGVEHFLMTGAKTLPESEGLPPGCMAMLAAVSDEWPIEIAKLASEIRYGSLESLRSRIAKGVADGELPKVTDIDRVSRFYLSIFQGMAVQAKDGATSADLQIMAEAAMTAWPAVTGTI